MSEDAPLGLLVDDVALVWSMTRNQIEIHPQKIA
jgi:hypothetical protein